jgi:hypothetical protein
MFPAFQNLERNMMSYYVSTVYQWFLLEAFLVFLMIEGHDIAVHTHRQKWIFLGSLVGLLKASLG